MKILQLSNRCPFPPKDGYSIAVFNVTAGLVRHGQDVTLLSMNTYRHFTAPDKIFSGYSSLCRQYFVNVDNRVKPLDAFFNIFSCNSYHITRFISQEFERKLVEILSSERFDIVHLEGLNLCYYITVIRKNTNAKIVFRAHNIEYLIWERLAANTVNPFKKWYLSLLAKRLKKFELSRFAMLDAIVPITERDAAFIRKFAGGGAVHVLPACVDLSRNSPMPPPCLRPSLFHLGALNWLPTLEGLKWFLREVWPSVHRMFPDVVFNIGGRNPLPDVFRWTYPNVIIHGEVEDAGKFLAENSILVVPLHSGSGMRVKIIEAMAAGKTVISTFIGAEGIDYTNGKNILIADTVTEFVKALSHCVGDAGMCSAIGNNAYRLIQEKYDNDREVKKLIDFYLQMNGIKKPQTAGEYQGRF